MNGHKKFQWKTITTINSAMCVPKDTLYFIDIEYQDTTGLARHYLSVYVYIE